jgi:hypothetical protein
VQLSLLDRERTVASPGYRRWLIPPAALAVHLSIGQVYAFSVFKEPLVAHVDHWMRHERHATIGRDMQKHNRNQLRPLLVLVAGPYRSGTGDDPDKLAANVEAMNETALAVFRAGHLPITGEALALPLIDLAGSRRVGDAVFDAIFHPIARRLLERCDAVMRIGGASAGADEMAALAREQGKPVFARVGELPQA